MASSVAFANVAVVDDEPEARKAYGLAIEDMDSIPILENGPIRSIEMYKKKLQNLNVNAVFCDYHLKKHDYATFNGDELASQLYQSHIPVVLCTNYTDWDLSVLRTRRRFIPEVIPYEDAEPKTILNAFQQCVAEFSGNFRDTRRPWRTLVRIEEISESKDYVYVVVPGWNVHKKIRVQTESFSQLRLSFDRLPTRLFAKVNIGAISDEQIYFCEWEL